MSYALVSAGTVVLNQFGDNATPAFGQATVAGDLLIALAQCNGGPFTPVTPAGWSLDASVASAVGGQFLAVFSKIAAGGDANPVIQITGSNSTAAIVAEFSGNAASSWVDQTGTGDGVATPITATATGTDSAAGELVVAILGDHHTKADTTTTSITFNNGASSNSIGDNDAMSYGQHYRFVWGVTTGNGVADAATGDDTSMNHSSATVLIQSYRLVPPLPLPEGFTKTRTVEQAVKRGAYYCLGEKWARRRSGLIAPAPGRDFVLA